MAERIKQELGVEVELVEADRGEFTVWVGEGKVAEKGGGQFPDDDKVLSAVRQALSRFGPEGLK